MSKHLNEIIKRLGYSNSPCLKYKSDNYNSSALTTHTIKVLNALSPFAAYMVDDEPFILFFDELLNQDEQKEVNKRIWNAQIPVAIFCSTTTIKIFNGCTINRNTQFLQEADTISFNTLDDIDENSPFSFWEITSQNFWKNYIQHFSGKKLNDALLDNLKYLTDKLKNHYKVSFATKLVLRLIFIRYLVDRGVNLDYAGFSSDVTASRQALLTLLSNRTDLYALFTHLKGKFYGNLFEQDNEDLDELTELALCEIKDFLSANAHLRQLSFFDLYDFDIIPVELISNIYEILLGKEAQNKDNAFYTPKYLVDFILDITIDKHIEQNNICKILDPSCGSGVFLVDSYRRMIEKKLCGEPFTENDSLLCDTLTDNIYGVDLNPDAIDVAIFSLYLAVLDYKNPKTLKQFCLPLLKGKNLLVSDYFDEDKLTSLQEVDFDFIIGNPPWGSKPGKHVDYCIKHGYKQYLQNNDTCRSFILRSKDFCIKNKKAVCCFVLHSKMLYMQGGPSKKFRSNFLLTHTKISHIIELSSVRKLVFKGADAPAIILSYEFTDENAEENRFEHISMKKNEFFRLFNIIVIEKTDVKSVQQKLLITNDWAWKTLVYGLTGDIDLLMKLKSAHPTLEDGIKSQSPKIIKGDGIKYNDGELKDASHLLKLKLPLLNSKNTIDHFSIIENNTIPFAKSKIDRPRSAALFKAPYCLVMKGIDTADYTMRAVYSETDFIFQAAIYAIKGSLTQKDFLFSVVGLLNSKLYAYFNLMLGSSLGVEREQRLFDEVLKFPYIFSKEIAAQVARIQELKKQAGNFVATIDTSEEINILDRMIFESFDIADNEFLDYALQIQIPLLTGENDFNANREVTKEDYELYGKCFYDYLSKIFNNVGKYVQLNVYVAIAKHYNAFEVIVLDKKPVKWLNFISGNNEKSMLVKLSAHKMNELFYAIKDVLYFEENSFYIIKTNYYKNWHPAIAQLDLTMIIDQILSDKNGGKN